MGLSPHPETRREERMEGVIFSVEYFEDKIGEGDQLLE
jgi:hypothetical protein